jgi:hypothetical protein
MIRAYFTGDMFRIVAASTATSLFFAALILLMRVEYIPDGPSRRIYEVTQSILQHARITPAGYYDMENFLREKTRQNQSEMWQDVFSLTKGGEVFPKHSLLSSIMLLPFVAAFGKLGVLVAALLIRVGTVICIYKVALALSPGITWVFSFAATVLGTQLFFATGGVPYDSLGGFLVISAVALATRYPLLAGFLVGLSVYCRPTNVTYILVPLLFIDLNRIIRVIFGASVAVGFFLFTNYLLWGGVLITSHHRMPSYRIGQPIFTGTTTDFNLGVLLSDWPEKLLSLDCGLLLYNPILFLLPLAGVHLLKDRRKVGIMLLCLTQILIVFSYTGWDASVGGSRYLCPTAWLMCAVIIASLHDKLSSKPRASGPDTCHQSHQ